MQLAQLSIVVVGMNHNPTILNTDFLSLRDIVPEAWKWDLETHPISTPGFAIVKYRQGVTITVEPNKLQVIENGSTVDPDRSQVAYIARKYVETLPNIRYTAVGINFLTLIEKPQPAEFIRSKFIKADPHLPQDATPSSVSVNFTYLQGEARITIGLDCGSTAEGSKTTNVLACSSNFHRETTAYPADGYVVKSLENVTSDSLIHRDVCAGLAS